MDSGEKEDTEVKQPAVPPVKMEDSPGNVTSPVATIAWGLDEKDGVEELRHACSAEDLLLSPTIPRRKVFGSFRLTPSLLDKKSTDTSPQSKGNGEVKADLVTPHQSKNLGEDYPGRPMKNRRSATINIAEKSCRHLFVQNTSISQTTRPPEDAEGIFPKAEGETFAEKETFPLCKPKATVDEPHVEGLELMLPCTPEDAPPADIQWCPSSSSSSCCSSCSSELSSPRLSQVKLISQTIESSSVDTSGDSEPESMEIVANPPSSSGYFPDPSSESDMVSDEKVLPALIADVGDASETSRNKNLFTKQAASTVKPMAPSDDDVKKPALPIAIAQTSMPKNKIIENLTASSGGSAKSNWTAMSGVSPLPASDPSHLQRHYHHHHHHRHPSHHHHHHHHHSHHHRHHHKTHHEASSDYNPEIRDFMYTSTPIHRKPLLGEMDVSAVAYNKNNDLSGLYPDESRFVLSSELQLSDVPLCSQESPLGQSKKDAQVTIEQWDSALNPSDKENDAVTRDVKDTKDAAVSSEKIVKMHQTKKRPLLPSDSEADVNIHTITMRKVFFNKRQTAKRILRAAKTGSKFRYNPRRSKSVSRPLSKSEIQKILSAPVNFTDDIWKTQLPLPDCASSFDESLVRPRSKDIPLSSTLE